MEAEEQNHAVVDAYRQSMTIVEEALSKLRATVCSWPTTPNVNLEPQKSMTIEHLEQMLSYLKNYNIVSNGGRTEEDISGREGTVPPNSGDHSGVRRMNLQFAIIPIRDQNRPWKLTKTTHRLRLGVKMQLIAGREVL